MPRLILFITLLLYAALAHAHQARGEATSTPEHYALTLRLDPGAPNIEGELHLRVPAGADGLVLDAGHALVIDRVETAGQAIGFVHAGEQLRIALPASRARRNLRIRYHGAPDEGLEFHLEREEAYTIFSTWGWMPSIDAPAARATFALTLDVPRHLTTLGNGRLQSVRKRGDRKLWTWRLAQPRPGFLYAFAVGPYRRLALPGRATRQWLYANTADSTHAQAFARSGAMAGFFAQKAGVPLPGGEYSQVLVAQTIGQEAAGFALLSHDYAAARASGEDDEGLIAHELAHQWWGGLVTCRDWGHFWLNEAFATFMAAAWLESVEGRASYLERVNAWQARVDALSAAGKDHALVFATWAPTADNRAVAYQKGALFLHTLREALGEAVFWRGVQRYLRENAGRSVVTADLQRALEATSHRDLNPLFLQWAGTGRE